MDSKPESLQNEKSEKERFEEFLQRVKLEKNFKRFVSIIDNNLKPTASIALPKVNL